MKLYVNVIHKRVSRKKKLNYSHFQQIQHLLTRLESNVQKAFHSKNHSIQQRRNSSSLNHHLIISWIERDSERELVPRTRFLLSRSDSLARGKSIIYYTSNFVS